MIGAVDEFGTPVLRLQVAGREFVAAIDTGFNGDLELPNDVAEHFQLDYLGTSDTVLAGGVVIREELYLIQFPFDGTVVEAQVAFAPVSGILIGTNLLRNYKLEISFVGRTVLLERVTHR